MKNKYFILVLTFLFLFIGHSSFAQSSGGDWEDFDTENDTINLPNLYIPPVGSNPDFSGSSIDQIYCALYPDLCGNSNVPHFDGESSDPNDPNSQGNGGYAGFDPLDPWNAASYPDYVDSGISSSSGSLSSYGYSGSVGQLVIMPSDGSMGIGYGQFPIEELADLKRIMNDVGLNDRDNVAEFAKNNPGIGVKVLNSYLLSKGNKEFFATLVVTGMIAALDPQLAYLAPTLSRRVLQYYNYEYNRLKLEHPDWTELKLSSTAALNVLQTGLDIVGLVPAIGEVADLANGAIYIVRGDLANAAVSGLALIPIGGQLATGSRVAVKIIDGVAVPIAKGADAVAALVKFRNKIDAAITSLKVGARFVLEGTGAYKLVGGHHALAKKAFEGVQNYNFKNAFSVSPSALDNASGITNTHAFITGQQNSLYSAWKNANPNITMTIDDMANIEIQAMKNVGIPEDIAKGWVVKALEDLKSQGVDQIKNIPWNNVNP